jgi:putative SOS response-associated peptidase YedK
VKDAPLFALAGLWEWWRDPATSQGVETYTIITTEANAAIAPLHDRMPVIVGEHSYERWLDAARSAPDQLVPYPPGDIVIERA